MVNEWNKTALVAEFETMLRRRLRSGAAPVTACAGFDVDAASAYLEGALGGSHRAGYESHLAGCVTCRRHLVELARLAQCASLAEPQIASAPNRIPVWGRWKESVAAWFDISSRGFKWQIASATGAAFAILIAALGLQSLRQVSKQPTVSIADSAVPANPTGPVELTAQPTPSPTLESSPQNGAFLDTSTSISQEPNTIHPENAQVLAPKPLVGPQGNDPNISVEAKKLYMSLPASSNQQVEAPVAPKPMPSAAQAGQHSQRLDPRSMESLSEVNAQRLSGRIEELEELAAAVRKPGRHQGAAKDPVQTLSAPPRINRMKSVPPDPVVRNGWISSYVPKEQSTPNQEPSSKADKSRIKDAWASVSSIVKRPIRWPFSDSEEKPSQDAQETSDAASLMPWRFRGKVFVFKKGVWIDREYKSEMQEWRRWTLTRGSDEYKRVLSEEPQLKDFFDKGPILLVWKNRIYKVQ